MRSKIAFMFGLITMVSQYYSIQTNNFNSQPNLFDDALDVYSSRNNHRQKRNNIFKRSVQYDVVSPRKGMFAKDTVAKAEFEDELRKTIEELWARYHGERGSKIGNGNADSQKKKKRYPKRKIGNKRKDIGGKGGTNKIPFAPENSIVNGDEKAAMGKEENDMVHVEEKYIVEGGKQIAAGGEEKPVARVEKPLQIVMVRDGKIVLVQGPNIVVVRQVESPQYAIYNGKGRKLMKNDENAALSGERRVRQKVIVRKRKIVVVKGPKDVVVSRRKGPQYVVINGGGTKSVAGQKVRLRMRKDKIMRMTRREKK